MLIDISSCANHNIKNLIRDSHKLHALRYINPIVFSNIITRISIITRKLHYLHFLAALQKNKYLIYKCMLLNLTALLLFQSLPLLNWEMHCFQQVTHVHSILLFSFS